METIERFDALPLRPMLAFVDRAYERRFLQHYNAFYYRYAQASLGVGLLLILSDFVVDQLFIRSESANVYRVQLCAPILALGIACSFTRFARRHWQSMMAGFIVVVSCSLFWVLTVIDGEGGMGLKSWVGILNFVFLEFYCFVILGVQFRHAFVSGALILLAFETAMFLELGPDQRIFGYFSYQVVTLFLLALGVGWWREFVLRRGFSAQTALTAAKENLRDQNAALEDQVRKRTRQLLQVQDATILTLASLVETRDNETGNHVRRTQHYVHALATRLRSHPRFAAYLTDQQIDILFKSAPLHDIGKVGIPDQILLKPGRLEPDEFEIMKTHTTLGFNAIEEAQKQLGIKVEFLACAQEIALTHHEKWDGSGYPQRLAGEAIPISARLMALADVYDALTSHRVYRPAMSHEEAAAVIVAGRSQHFDPEVVDAFLAIAGEFRIIAERYADAAAPAAGSAAPQPSRMSATAAPVIRASLSASVRKM